VHEQCAVSLGELLQFSLQWWLCNGFYRYGPSGVELALQVCVQNASSASLNCSKPTVQQPEADGVDEAGSPDTSTTTGALSGRPPAWREELAMPSMVAVELLNDDKRGERQ
jgi:hypothetical protein